ncbi:MAG: biopolymer transporter ExbD [Bacteroidia bacterium]|nr:biopolymer transporter ExbD [Bacteroidia bacterium]
MSDIAFLLLLFFLIILIASPQLFENSNLPQSSQGEKASIEGHSLFIDKEGTLYLDKAQINFEEIPLSEKIAVYSDKTTPFEVIFPLINYLKQNSVTTIQLLVRQANE